MDTTSLTDGLNDKQREAVIAPFGNYLVLAGAGSGKTRVLVHRIAWLLSEHPDLGLHNLLAVTFTNKAAKEMRSRIEAITHRPSGAMWMGTFHGLAHRMLRRNPLEAGLPQEFQIIDNDDQHRLIRQVLDELGLDPKRWAPRRVQAFINDWKDQGVRAARAKDHFADHEDEALLDRKAQIYDLYEKSCERSGLVDFAELLLRCNELLDKRREILSAYQERFVHLLVDEFQDTNEMQYRWLRLLAGGDHSQLYCVGDDDQSIYGWRGARIDNIRKFDRDFSNVTTIRLEQNYRSTGNILAAANGLIDHNRGRLGKNLWTADESGEPVSIYAAYNERDEADIIVEGIERLFPASGRYDDFAVLYRVSAQSRILESCLSASRIPFRVYGGLRFYARGEIKNALAYCRLALNRDDDVAFARVVNFPPRGIGDRTIGLLHEGSVAQGQSLWVTARSMIQRSTLTARARESLRAFLDLIDSIADEFVGLSLKDRVQIAIDRSDLREHYAKKNKDPLDTKISNLEELLSAAEEFVAEEASEDDEGEPLQDDLSQFLDRASLDAGDQEDDEQAVQERTGRVQLMTLHAAKGLEFPVVFLCGMEEGLFPHNLSMEDPDKLEEERRLCYVGMTRAKRKLHMSYAETRRLHGTSSNESVPSRFLNEIPSNRVHREKMGGTISRPLRASSSDSFGYANQGRRSAFGNAPNRMMSAAQATTTEMGGLRLGQRVSHPKFGEGTVLHFEGQDEHGRVQVRFERAGSKWLVIAYAKLSPIA
ncbi:DNA helicase II [Thioalkalivibrio sp. HK1]|uniref:DNA helicase II n=1 Tax=Thioalkalivibrio sp. HK1 TaxID=1469245 RepID=UPI000472733D|nr:DNA helicase II [Thioalkalivibrio sp. HK1]